MSDGFKPTHVITFTPAVGAPQRTEVMLLDGAAYDRDEWRSEVAASWERDDNGEWWFQGAAAPGLGTVEVRAVRS